MTLAPGSVEAEVLMAAFGCPTWVADLAGARLRGQAVVDSPSHAQRGGEVCDYWVADYGFSWI